MTTWSSFQNDKLLVEGWRSFLEEEQKVVYGLNAKDNPDSLINILNKAANFLTPEQKIAIVNLIANAASDEEVMLEAVTLQGLKSEQDRVFSGATTREILQGIAALGLEAQNNKTLVKALNYWGRVNSIKFEKPVTATPVTPVEEPEQGEATSQQEAPPEEETSSEEEPQTTAQEIKQQYDSLPDEEKEEIKKDIEILTQVDVPDKEGLRGLVQNPMMIFGAFGFNGYKALKSLVKLKEQDQLTAKNLGKVGAQFIFDNTDSFLFDVLPDNSLYLLKQGQFSELARALGANISSDLLGVLNAAESGCAKCKKIGRSARLISKLPELGPIIVALAGAFAVILCPIASLKGILEPLIASGSLEGLEKDPYYRAGLMGNRALFRRIDNNSKLSIIIGDSAPEIPEDEIEAIINAVEKVISEEKIENIKDAQHYLYGLKSFKAITNGLKKIDRDKLPDMSEPEEEQETEKVEPVAPPEALQESKQMLRWKLIAGIK